MRWYIATKEISYNKYDFVDTENPDIKKGIFGFDERGENTQIDLSYEDLIFEYFKGNVCSNFEVMKTNRKLEDFELTVAMKNISNPSNCPKNYTVGWYECDVFMFNQCHFKQFDYIKTKQLLEDRVKVNDFEKMNLSMFWKSLLLIKLKEMFPIHIYNKFARLSISTDKEIRLIKPESFFKRHKWYSKIENMTPFELSYSFYEIN